MSTGLIVGLALGGSLLVILIVAAFGLVYELNKAGSGPAGSAAADVQLTSCDGDRGSSMGSYEAAVRVTNHGRNPASYAITVAFTSGDGEEQWATAVATVSDLEPGQTTSTTATALAASKDMPSGFKCKIVRVSRL